MSATPCILVAGASKDGRRHIAQIMSAEPWHIISAADGDAVIDLVQADTADLLLMESETAGLDGVELVRRIRRDGKHRFLPIVIVSSSDDIANRVAALNAGADDYFSKPLAGDEVIARVRSMLRLKEMRDRMENSRQVIFALAKAAEAKDSYTLEHAERVADGAGELARRLKMSADAIDEIRAGALVHDVGKLAVPDHILNKPGPLTAEEFAVVQTHPVVGSEIVHPLSAQRHLYGIVRSHHERFDGMGYPDRLAGQAIPVGARIVAVCDAYDAMVNQRPYRPAIQHSVAIEILVAGRGSQWDPAAVDAFVAIQEQR